MVMDEKLKRPALKWYGGKWRMAPWIIEHMPLHRVYVEPFGGAASVLLRKPRSSVEVYNDLNKDIVNYFRVLRDPAKAAELVRMLELTPFSRQEHTEAFEYSADSIESARRLVIRAYMSFSAASAANNINSGFMAGTNRGGKRGPVPEHPHQWTRTSEATAAVARRFSGVMIENRNALEVIKQQDASDVLFYVDPPYMMETRIKGGKEYAHEMTDADHVALAETLKNIAGMAIISGYESGLYADLYKDWAVYRKASRAHGSGKRTEVIWVNGAARKGLEQMKTRPL